MIISCHILDRAGFKYRCCDSCHDEDDEGYTYGMNEQFPSDAKDAKSKHCESKIWAHVCCSAPELETVSDWAKVVRTYRKIY